MRIKKLIPKLPDVPNVLWARQFIENNLADRATVTNTSTNYLRAYLYLEAEEKGYASILVEVLQYDYRYDAVGYSRYPRHLIIISWDPRRK